MNLWCDGFGRYGGDEAKMLNGSSGSKLKRKDDPAPVTLDDDKTLIHLEDDETTLDLSA